MKIAITGHTHGLGRKLYNHLSKTHEVKGFSRSNGYSLPDKINDIVEESSNCDLFINNAYADGSQLDLFNALKDKVPKMIIMGSVSRFYQKAIPIEYSKNKQILFDAVRMHNLLADTSSCLHLDISFLELEEKDFSDPYRLKSDNWITYDEIIKTVDFWMLNSFITNIEFKGKYSSVVKEELKRINPEFDESQVE